MTWKKISGDKLMEIINGLIGTEGELVDCLVQDGELRIGFKAGFIRIGLAEAIIFYKKE